MADYTTDNLIKEIKRRGSLPTDQQLVTSDGYLDFANEQLQGFIVPMMMEVREEYFVSYSDLDIVSGQQMYRIPEKAVGQKLRDVTIVDGNDSEYNLPRYRQEFRIDDYSSSPGGVRAFFIRSNKIGLYPTPTDTKEKLRLYFFRRPGELVPTNEAAKINTVDNVNNSVVVDNAPANMSAGTTVDVIRGTPGFETVYDDIQIVSRSGTDIELSKTEDIEEGDWIALSGQSPIAQIPVEAHRVLAQDTVAKVFEAIGDNDGYKVAQNRLDTMTYHFLTTITPRVEGEEGKVVSSSNISHHINNHTYGGWGTS